jgi:C1A family cysteine protease
VYESFEAQAVAQTGILREMPTNEERVLGGHAVMAVGYTDRFQCFIVRNSWGSNWGDQGHCYMPYKYLTERKLSADFWTIRLST